MTPRRMQQPICVPVRSHRLSAGANGIGLGIASDPYRAHYPTGQFRRFHVVPGWLQYHIPRSAPGRQRPQVQPRSRTRRWGRSLGNGLDMEAGVAGLGEVGNERRAKLASTCLRWST